MKKIIGLVVIMLLTTCLVACGKTKADYKLAVRANSWYYGTANGANSEDDPGVEFEVETGKSYSYGSCCNFSWSYSPY